MTADHATLLESFRRDASFISSGFLIRRNRGRRKRIYRLLFETSYRHCPKLKRCLRTMEIPRPSSKSPTWKCPYFDHLLIRFKNHGTRQALLEGKLIPQSIQLFNKPPRKGTATPPHQDGFYYCLVPNEP